MPRQPRLALHVCAGAIAALSGLAIAMPDAPTDLAPALSSLRTAPMTVVSTIGKTREGRDIPLITLGDAARRDTNPAILIVAGIHGDHWVGTDVALGLAQTIARDHADAVRTTTVYIVPRVNLDAANAHSSNKALRASRSTTTTPVDTDKDRRVDEDGPEDLNRDGVISQMRVKNPPPHLKATHILDPDNEGLLREADASKGEIAQYAILTEGIDNDNDGKYNEDAPGAQAMSGVDLDKNFPHLWPEHTDGAGRYALSESESLALATFVLDRPNIDAVLVFGPHDTLVALPQAGKMDVTGRAPLGIENADKAHFERISKSFKDATGMTASPDKDDAGAFWSWAYAQGGAWSFSTPVWVRPDQIKREGDKKDDQADATPNGNAEPRAAAAPEGPSNEELRAMIAEFESADDAGKAEMMAQYNSMPPAVQARIMAMAQGQQPEQPSAPERPAAARPGRSTGTGGAGGAGGAKKNESDDAKWLALAKERGEGFVEWTTFDHPQLGEVEIGGFVPGFQLNPPSEEVDRLVSEQATFVKSLIEELPRLTLDDAVVERVGDNVFRVSITARNGGKLPTASAIAVKSRAKQPLVLRLEGDEKAILAGDRVQRATSIPGGGHERFEWLVAGREGSNISVTVRSPQTGEKKINVALRATNKEGGR
jgi:hypothetical protein